MSYGYEIVWNKAKISFLERMSYFWLFGNKIFEGIFFLGVFLCFFGGWFLQAGCALAIYSGAIMFYRQGLWDGYYEGYENGFINSVQRPLEDIKNHKYSLESENHWHALEGTYWNPDNPDEAKALEEEEARIRLEGFRKLLGWILTWKKVNFFCINSFDYVNCRL